MQSFPTKRQLASGSFVSRHSTEKSLTSPEPRRRKLFSLVNLLLTLCEIVETPAAEKTSDLSLLAM
ncbi:hypothetical protein EJ08DRAFT_648228 [Tothia fuscella]|uniref:Uncharacterized protein n=1 Tax=Tothia fuscella TaxID=1048955 RepID=A0A9P4NVI8_9PEZI|nr:hypothetical protein EJ08DRAFT_648228 [Tothia fuscella]